MAPKSRNAFLRRLPPRYRREAVVFKVSRETLDRRLMARAEATGKHIPTNVVDDMIARYVPPSADEFDSIEDA